MRAALGRTLKLGVPLLVFGGALAVFGVVNDDGDAGRSPVAAVTARADVVAPGAGNDERIAVLQRAVRAAGTAANYAALGGAYLQHVRETGDPGFYTRAEGVLRRATARDPRNVDAVIGLGTLALARHDFAAALQYGLRARRLAPAAYGAYPVVIDALVELGRYDQAGRVLQRLVDGKPGLPAYARASYFQELHGDLPSAVATMRLAVSAGSATPEGAAYVQTLLGNLQFGRGRVAAARAAYRSALRAQPAFPAARAGMARTSAARGDLAGAITTLRGVVAQLPLPEYIVALGEAELAAGRTRQAREDLALVAVERRLLAAGGVDADVELAIFEADHGSPRQGVGLARRAWAAAPSVRAADALGWALTRAGSPKAGYAWARRALRLGWREPLAVYHAGMSARAAGQPAAARRLLGGLLRQAPRFSPLHAPRARRALRSLG
ncbi:Lipopolysaccharide assembly protein B [Paraconexibacter sp. AEG42_29]|uniref:Lipopolysaccharide assembly protein B n=1 Tax=Paraconexibacter sp. AEG42_29 TaxID=2997339 RepID=A0AAU7AXX6_9ACTN